MVAEASTQTDKFEALDKIYDQPKDVLGDEHNQLTYAEVSAQFRTLVRSSGGSIVDEIHAERAAFLYAYIRKLEADAGFDKERNHKEMNALLLNITDRLSRLQDVNADAIRQDVAEALSSVAKSMSDEMDSDQAEKFLTQMAEAMESAGL